MLIRIFKSWSSFALQHLVYINLKNCDLTQFIKLY